MKINKKIISRLSRYRNALARFSANEIDKVLSEDIAKALGITPAQVRKDFSMAGITGKRKSGYAIQPILATIEKLLRKDEMQHAILAGAGTLGQALLEDFLTESHGVKVIAAFDDAAATPSLENHGKTIPVFGMEQMVEFIRRENILYGIIAGKERAQNFLDLMVLAGVKGILSFAPVELKSPKKCVVHTVNLLHEFENVVCFSQGQKVQRPKSAQPKTAP